jgi:transposase
VFRLRPTSRQHVALAACVEAHRELYNAALQERRDGWSHASKTRISYGDQSAQLTGIRAVRPDQAVWSFSSQQATLRRLNKAFAGFFRLQRARHGGKNGAAKRETVAARHRKIGNQRKDFHHKQARELAARYDRIVVEDLKIANMLRRAKPIPDPDNARMFLPNGARAKTGLNRSISDAGWGQFVSILHAKAEEAGRAWIEVDPRHTSDGCESCGHAARANRVTQAEFACQRCGHTAPADEHAARNILRAGLAHHADAA